MPEAGETPAEPVNDVWLELDELDYEALLAA